MKGKKIKKFRLLLVLVLCMALGFFFWLGPKQFLNDILHPKQIIKQVQVSIGQTIWT